jgi:hypothetical protein
MFVNKGAGIGQLEQWFREKQVERTISALRKNNFEALYVSDSKTALEEVMKRIPDGATVGVGGRSPLLRLGCWMPPTIEWEQYSSCLKRR